MDVYREIRDELKKQYDAGATQQELADQFGVARSYIARLINGDRPIQGISLETFFRLFPQAKVSLHPNRSALAVDDLDSKIIELLAQLPQSEKVELLVALSRKTVKSAPAENQKIG